MHRMKQFARMPKKRRQQNVDGGGDDIPQCVHPLRDVRVSVIHLIVTIPELNAAMIKVRDEDKDIFKRDRAVMLPHKTSTVIKKKIRKNRDHDQHGRNAGKKNEGNCFEVRIRRFYKFKDSAWILYEGRHLLGLESNELQITSIAFINRLFCRRCGRPFTF